MSLTCTSTWRREGNPASAEHAEGCFVAGVPDDLVGHYMALLDEHATELIQQASLCVSVEYVCVTCHVVHRHLDVHIAGHRRCGIL